MVRRTDASSQLLALADELDVAMAIAVIPRVVDTQLVSELAGTSHSIWQHGYSHQDHSGVIDGAGCELDDCRDPRAVDAELTRGRHRLESLFGDRFDPVLVPPFGRIGPRMVARVGRLGYRAISRHRASGIACLPPIPSVDTRVDVLRWTSPPSAMADDVLYCAVAEAARADLPIGLLTHHLVMPQSSWSFVADLVRLVDEHPAARWISPSRVLDRVVSGHAA